ncbi:MAG TPA: glycosyltransferase family 2 protein, partial [Xanthobacteraceae bacterium]
TRAITHKAAEELRCTRPDLCAARGEPRALRWALIGAGLAAAMWLAPAATQTTVGAALALVFLAWIALRLIGFLTPKEAPRRAPALADDRLPTYTIIVALYREAAVVEGLVAALDALDYPREKLDIKLVLESDDLATRAAIAALDLGPPYEVVMAPRGDPRTKPKALNAALLFARGAFTAVYDAEDRPEPDQLRRALERFRQEPELACVQARLSIYNAADDWLTRLFAAEYCGLFDVFLPALAACRLPFPLGGSSNHFRTAVLRAIGGWDPYNVTEDADLGVRLARFGHRMGVIASTTFEEAPVGVAAWLWQRTRWFKGWMQTWIVHMRAPVSLARELPLSAFLAFQLTVGGTVVAALVHPLFLAALIHAAATGQPVLGAADDATAVALAGLHGLSCLAGYLVTTALCLLGLSRRRLLAHAWALALLPVLWLLLSLAAWCAVFELVRDPYRWNKTEHGCAKSPRRAHA